MKFPRLFAAGLVMSVLGHSVGSAFFAPDSDEVQIETSRGGAVSVIGSIEDMVAGSKADSVEAPEPLEEVDPETIVDPVRTAETINPVTPVVAVEPVQAVQLETRVLEAVSTAVSAPVVEGVTTTDQVTKAVPEAVEPVRAQPMPANRVAKPVPADARPVVEPAQSAAVEPVPVPPTPAPTEARPIEAKPVVPVPMTEPDPAQKVKPVETARVVEPEARKPLEPVEPEAATAEPVDPLAAVSQTPRVKPEPPAKQAEPVKRKQTVQKQVAKKPAAKKPAAQARKKGADANTRRGGEQVTSKTARSNANGRADAKGKERGGAAAASNYAGKVYSRLARAKGRAAKRRKRSQSGLVVFVFSVSRDGRVSNVRITRSSGHANLDKATLRAVAALRMPKFPAAMKGNSKRFEGKYSFE